jgi:hypothetical protein
VAIKPFARPFISLFERHFGTAQRACYIAFGAKNERARVEQGGLKGSGNEQVAV